jgi:hypothetical protein
MELLLTNASDKQHYAHFLAENDISFSVPHYLVIPFVNYLQKQHSLLDSVSTEVTVEPETTESSPISRARWNESDVSNLSYLLGQNLSLPEIANQLGRTEDSIRKYARTHFNLVYRKQKWVDLTYPGSSVT